MQELEFAKKLSELPAGTPLTGTAGGVMRRVHGIETGYLNMVRFALAIAVGMGVLAVGGAILWYAVVHMTTSETRNARDYFEAPTWDGVRHLVLPTPLEQQPSTTSPASQGSTTARGRRPVDERIDRIADNLNAQFSRNVGDETGFTDRYPRRLLESWVFQEPGMRQTYQADYVEQLIAASKTIGADPQINRIGSMDDRARVIMEALDAFRLAFLGRIEQAESRAAEARAHTAARRSEAAQGSIYLGLGGFGLLISMVLIVVLLRIEVHLRNQVHLQALAQAPRRRADSGSPADA